MKSTGEKRNGIVAAGNWVVDHLKVIDLYPAQDSLANIKKESSSNGGSPYNILKNLAKLGAPFPLKGIGLVGDDNDGSQIKQDCKKYNIDASSIQISPLASTSYTDVMVVESSGRRTFFHHRGANAFLDIEHFDFSTAKEKIFHLGYLLLLDALDRIYEDGTSGASRLLEKACQAGLKTSVDLVSEDSNRFKMIIHPSLPYVHYLFLNEFEAARCTGVNLQVDQPDYDALNKAATIILEYGVREWVFIHFPKGVFAKSNTGEIIVQGAVNLPDEKIKSASGAGDALASGILFGIHEEWKIPDALKLGVCCAAYCLQELSCSKGVLPYNKCLEIGEVYGYRNFQKPVINQHQ
jgi:sugar/nucleoside kinase (ribokinase family)